MELVLCACAGIALGWFLSFWALVALTTVIAAGCLLLYRGRDFFGYAVMFLVLFGLGAPTLAVAWITQLAIHFIRCLS